MKVVLIDEDVEKVVEFGSVAELEAHLCVSDPDGTWNVPEGVDPEDTLYCWICPYAEEICGKRVISSAFTLEDALYRKEQATDDI